MTDERRDITQVMMALGELTGAVKAMQSSLSDQINNIRSDIRNLESRQSERMDRIEDNLGKRIDDVETRVGARIDGLGTRVTALENEDKRLIDKTAKLSAMGGGIGGALAAGVVEVLKHL